MTNKKERQNRDELFKLMKENPDLPVVAMVDGEVVYGDGYGRYFGTWGYSYIDEYIIGEEYVHFRDDNDPSAIETLISEKFGYDTYEAMSDEEVDKAYAEMPWIKAIIVNIDLPD